MIELVIFTAALAKADPAARSAYLDRACGGDPALRRRVEALLLEHEGGGNPLGATPPGLDTTAGPRATPAAGDGPATDPETAAGPGATVALGEPAETVAAEGESGRIGPYRLVGKLGEGGMGTVYLAEQEHPVRRRVALKVIKAGMDSGQVVARFEVERQALAIMDHPNIARVLDAGATEAGRPYFVMELVDGVPITGYCDRNHLTPRERLELFVPVCRAIQHAHQKGIIHRDIKPSNVLVTTVDGRPTPKVIDFGVAKAVDRRMAEHSPFTQLGAIVGTLEYMSPEQADLGAVDVDTRTDIYALGVLLYELLTGTTPLERSRLRMAGFAEILRRIREEEPPRPSTRLSDSGEALPSIAANRRTEPSRIAGLMRGELDWIVMKSLEKDRARRYETAAGFARDVERHLNDEPVEACPPSASYRLRKFARRNRALLATASAFAALLIAGVTVGTALAIRARDAERVALKRLKEVEQADAATRLALEQTRAARDATAEALRQSEAVGGFLATTLRSPDSRADGKEVKVVDLLDRAERKLKGGFAGPPSIRGALLESLGSAYRGLGLFDRAVAVLELSRSVRRDALGPDHPDTLGTAFNLAGAHHLAGRPDAALPLYEEALRLQEATLGPDHPDTLMTLSNRAAAYRDLGRTAEAIPLFEEALRRHRAKLGDAHNHTLSSLNNLAGGYYDSGRYAEAVPLFEEAWRRHREIDGADHPDTLQSMGNLAATYEEVGRLAEAIPLHEEALRLKSAKLGADHPDTLLSMHNLSYAYASAGRSGEATGIAEAALKLRKAKLGPGHTDTLASMVNLGERRREAGRTAEAIALFREALAALEKAGPDHPFLIPTLADLGGAYREAGRVDEAIARLTEALGLQRAKFGDGHPITGQILGDLAAAYREADRPADLEALLRDAIERARRANPADAPALSVMQGRLGDCLLGQGRFREAEPLLIAGYEGIKAREAKPSPTDRAGLLEAGERIIRLYEAWGRPAEADAWRARLGVAPGDLPADVFRRP